MTQILTFDHPKIHRYPKRHTLSSRGVWQYWGVCGCSQCLGTVAVYQDLTWHARYCTGQGNTKRPGTALVRGTPHGQVLHWSEHHTTRYCTGQGNTKGSGTALVRGTPHGQVLHWSEHHTARYCTGQGDNTRPQVKNEEKVLKAISQYSHNIQKVSRGSIYKSIIIISRVTFPSFATAAVGAPVPPVPSPWPHQPRSLRVWRVYSNKIRWKLQHWMCHVVTRDIMIVLSLGVN